MITLFITGFVSILQLADTSQIFYSKITSDFTRHSYYLSFTASFTDYQGPVIIENDDLYSFFNRDGTLTRETYQNEIVQRLVKNDFKFEMKFPNKGFVKVVSLAKVTKSVSKGKERFIKTYFKNNVIRKNLSEDERSAVISNLFAFQIASKMEDETGILVIRIPAAQ